MTVKKVDISNKKGVSYDSLVRVLLKIKDFQYLR